MVDGDSPLDLPFQAEHVSGPVAIVFRREETPQALDTSRGSLELAKVPGQGRHLRQDLIRQLRFSSNPLKTAVSRSLACPDIEWLDGSSTYELNSALSEPTVSGGVEILFDTFNDLKQERYNSPKLETILAGIHCLDAVQNKNVKRVMRQFHHEDALQGCPAKDPVQSTLEALRAELKKIHTDTPGSANYCIDALTQSPLGRAIIRSLYFGGWSSDEDTKAMFHISDYRGLLDVRAFIGTAHGRVTLNGLFLLLFWLSVVALFCFGRPFGEFSPTYDPPILCFWMGTVLDEASEFYKQPRYLNSIWNQMDCMIFAALAAYFAFKPVEPICRMMVSITVVVLMMRMLGIFRNAEHWPVKDLGLLIQTTIQMLRSISSFMMLYFYVLLSFAVGFLFLFYGTSYEEKEDAAERKLRMHIGEWDKDGLGPFSSMQSTALWLFDASLGEFNFEEVSYDLYGFLGTGMLIVFLILSPIVLMNFLIAKLSSTYEAALENSRKVHLFGLAQDALQKPYIPDLRDVPWMPPPVNLVNVIILWTYQLLRGLLEISAWVLRKMCKSDLQDRLDFWRSTLRGIHFRAQLLLVVCFGNVLMICLFAITNGIMRVVYMVIVVVLSPFLTIFCLAILAIGHLQQEWRLFNRDQTMRGRMKTRQKSFSRRRTQGLCQSSPSPTRARGGPLPGEQSMLQPEPVARRLDHPFHFGLLRSLAGGRVPKFYEGLHWRKQVILCGPPVSLLGCVVYAFLGELKIVFENPVFRFYLPVLDVKHMNLGILQNDTDLVDMLTTMLMMEIILVWCQFLWSFGAFLKWLFEVAGRAVMNESDRREALLDGWKTMIRFACLAAEANSNDVYLYIPAESTVEGVPGSPGCAKESSARKFDHVGIQPEASADDSCCALDGGGADRNPSITRMQMDITDFFLTFFVSDGQEYAENELLKMKPLLVQAVQLIYSGAIVTQFFENLALFIDIQDWYLVVCSIVWCHSADRSELELINLQDPEKKREFTLEPGQVERLRKHPLFGLYCFTDDEDNFTGVFFEDFFWAVWSEYFSKRYMNVETLLRGLRDLDAEQYVHEEEEELSHFASSLQVGGQGL